VKYFLTIILLAGSYWSHAQSNDSAFKLVRIYKGDIMNAAVDRLDNLYIISSTGQVKKYGPQGDSIGVFNGVRNYGKLYSIDVSNPLRLLLFYKDFSTVVILDRFLANRSTLDLRKYSILQPSAIGLSYDNNIWVFDQYDNKLKRIDEQGNKLMETPDFRSIFNQPVSPQQIINENGYVYLADSANGIYVFDNYGTFKRKVSLTGWNSIEVKNGVILRTTPGEVVLYNPSTFRDYTQKIPPSFKPYIHSFTGNNKFITFNDNELRIYQLTY
jgi:hypothetical protein